ncbi:MAG: helix-hairpin-helix domain-containing protein [Eubacterium sp.]|nr:helix-hairpin-helix domain-containing protein [Eubacterium sp.]
MSIKLKIFPVVCILVLTIFMTGCDLSSDNDMKISVMKTEVEQTEEETVSSEEPHISEDVTEETSVYVYLCGAVVNEDVYCVPAGSRVNDVVKLAGGFRDGAAAQYVNLAEVVTDGERIYIPYEDEIDADTADILLESKESNLIGSSESQGKKLVNINSADKSELMTLPGIGGSKADDIIRYREESGGFGSIEDLMNVNGIKEGTFQKLKDKITIG